MRNLVALALVGGCSFSADTSPINGDKICPFEYTPAYLDPCAVTPPVPLDELHPVTITGMTTIDTTTGAIMPLDAPIATAPTTIVDDVLIVWTDSLTITSNGTLRATGYLPLAIVATSVIRIEGTVDVSSNPSGRGAGANQSTCGEATGKPGQTCQQHAGSGGGGGAFGANGGIGGEGGDTHDCGGGVDGYPGGMGGTASVPPALRGGCDGGNGAPNNANDSVAGAAGAGGGAVALLARDRVLVSDGGKILAGGGGGQPGKVRAGGGGGGSGGMIVIEAKDVELHPSSLLAANGGAGAGGCDGGTAQPGAPGSASTAVALGGAKDGNGGQGGVGGALAEPMGQPGALGSRGGGGGGGGVGFIRVHAQTGAQSGIASPAITKN